MKINLHHLPGLFAILGATAIAGTLLAPGLQAAPQEIAPSHISTLPACSHRELGQAAANLIESLPLPTPEPLDPEECFGRVCDARAASRAALDFAQRMRHEEYLWVRLDSARRACGY